MKHTISHDLDMALAKKATERAIEQYSEQFSKYNPQFSWVDEHRGDLSFKAKGVTLTGSVELRAGAIDIDLDVPFLLKPFRKQALELVESKVHEWIKKAENGELS